MRVLTEEQQKWCDTIGEFCKKEIEPIMLEWDKIVDPSKAIPMDVYAKAFKLGLLRDPQGVRRQQGGPGHRRGHVRRDGLL